MISELHTPRLLLHPLNEGDADVLHQLVQDADVTEYTSIPPRTREQSDAMLQGWLSDMRRGEVCSWTLRTRAGSFVGQASLFGIDRDNLRAEIGYVLAKERWGMGYANEAIAALVRFAFGSLKLCRLEADVDPANIASWRALERNGFRREGMLPKRWHKSGRFYDTWLYGLLNETRIRELEGTS